MTPIRQAVTPLLSDAQDAAEKRARALIEKIAKELQEAGNDLRVIAPYPSSSSMSKRDYHVARGKYSLYRSVAKLRDTFCRGIKDPELADICPDKIERFVRMAREDAAAQYEVFIVKLEGKVGDCVSATLNGNHVWGRSTLTITKAGGTVQRWLTQTIINVSPLGKLFNQYPTRLIK